MVCLNDKYLKLQRNTQNILQQTISLTHDKLESHIARIMTTTFTETFAAFIFMKTLIRYNI